MNVNPYDLGTESDDQDMDESSLLDTSSIKNYEEKISKVRSFIREVTTSLRKKDELNTYRNLVQLESLLRGLNISPSYIHYIAPFFSTLTTLKSHLKDSSERVILQGISIIRYIKQEFEKNYPRGTSHVLACLFNILDKREV